MASIVLNMKHLEVVPVLLQKHLQKQMMLGQEPFAEMHSCKLEERKQNRESQFTEYLVN